jgi:predicted Rossmann fold nucleotide-binding protein DprA/Smf involved in DNA uptake
MSRSVAWTGHRPELFRDPVAARDTVQAIARELSRDEGVGRFLVGGQRGVDTWAALSAITLSVPFVVILPLDVAEFTADWSADDRSVLEATLAAASDVRVVGGDPAQAFTERNRLLATLANLLVAVWTGTRGGGTAETIAFARAAGVAVHEVVLEPSPSAGSAKGRGI